MRNCLSINVLTQLRPRLQDHRHHQRLHTQTLIARQPLNRPIHTTRQRPTRSEHHHPSRDVSSRQTHIPGCPTATDSTGLTPRSPAGSSHSWAPGRVLIRLRGESNPPIVCPGRHHQTRPPSHGRGGSQPTHTLTTRIVRAAPAARPGTGGAKPPGVICCQVVHQATTVTVSALPSSGDDGSWPGVAVAAVNAAAVVPAGGWLRRCRSHPRRCRRC